MAIIDPTPLQFLRTLVQEINIIGPLDPTPPQYRNKEKIMKETRMLEKADKVTVLEKSTEHEPLEQLEKIQLSVEEKSVNILQENARRYNSRLAAGLEPSSEDEEEMSEQELLHRLQEYATIYNYHTPIARQPSYMSEKDIMLDLCEPVYELVPGVDVDAFMENFFLEYQKQRERSLLRVKIMTESQREEQRRRLQFRRRLVEKIPKQTMLNLLLNLWERTRSLCEEWTLEEC